MNKEAEKNKLRETHKLYANKVAHLWNKLTKKYEFDDQTALTIIADFWYEPDNAEKFEEEWHKGIDKIKENIEKQFNVFIEHEEEIIIVRNENFVYDGDIVIEEEKY